MSTRPSVFSDVLSLNMKVTLIIASQEIKRLEKLTKDIEELPVIDERYKDLEESKKWIETLESEIISFFQSVKRGVEEIDHGRDQESSTRKSDLHPMRASNSGIPVSFKKKEDAKFPKGTASFQTSTPSKLRRISSTGCRCLFECQWE
eukprot:TRINITY_DN9338_c0_g1_i5.p2 TRINITY_DN9338_c0_g1~~TRINITY_DN9338_c0_g1_i5.p2  ORF type:complete len:148 (-),score=25.47 TRINITY_DN9338_c0_g1_i5:131-574(-)